MKQEIIKFLKKYDTITTYMTDDECIEYFRENYPNDYKSLTKLYGE